MTREASGPRLVLGPTDGEYRLQMNAGTDRRPIESDAAAIASAFTA